MSSCLFGSAVDSGRREVHTGGCVVGCSHGEGRTMGPSGRLGRRRFLRDTLRLGVALSGLGLAAGCTLPASPFAPAAKAKVRRVGFLSITAASDPAIEAFRDGLRERGWVEDETLTV